MSEEFVLLYRNWQLTITDPSTSPSASSGCNSGQARAVATTADGERFECYWQADTEKVLRLIVDKIDWLEGPEEWDMDYTDGALK